MAMVRKTLEQIKADRPKVDRAKMIATTEREIRRDAREDGDDPDGGVTGLSLVLPPQAVRSKLGMTQEQFAKALHIPLPTLRNWEQGRTLPDPAARALLTIVAREPEAALRALQAA
ncbi:helix-turn-helix domain-containing protein [Bosea sp. 2KB_26]|uniref:helix-turn-helix domain-containing protein n=1 Tax=Bosea sp. 2KB_26 TaxID=3237475 RepID=UPI000DE29CE7